MFKRQLRAEIEKNLRDHYGGSEDNADYLIANISLIFKNSEVVCLLEDRGQALKAGNFTKVRAVEKEITNKKNDPETL